MSVQDLMGSVVMNAQECAAECENNPSCNIAAYLTTPDVYLNNVNLSPHKSAKVFSV